MINECGGDFGQFNETKRVSSLFADAGRHVRSASEGGSRGMKMPDGKRFVFVAILGTERESIRTDLPACWILENQDILRSIKQQFDVAKADILAIQRGTSCGEFVMTCVRFTVSTLMSVFAVGERSFVFRGSGDLMMTVWKARNVNLSSHHTMWGNIYGAA
eukprot:893615-Pyramimonas_sp.AAC.2